MSLALGHGEAEQGQPQPRAGGTFDHDISHGASIAGWRAGGHENQGRVSP
jgi:hypothetical protein